MGDEGSLAVGSYESYGIGGRYVWCWNVIFAFLAQILFERLVHVPAYAFGYENSGKMSSCDDSIRIAMLQLLHGHVYSVGAESLTHLLVSVVSGLFDGGKTGDELRVLVVHIEAKNVDLHTVVDGGHLYAGNYLDMMVTAVRKARAVGGITVLDRRKSAVPVICICDCICYAVHCVVVGYGDRCKIPVNGKLAHL